VVLHADVLKDTQTTFEVLADRGLSTHFAIEWDGTIYQMLDPRDVAFAAAEANPYAVQIDLNNVLPNLVTRPAAPPYPRGHRRSREMAQPRFARPKSPRLLINRRDVQSWGYTDAQYQALAALIGVLSGVLDRVAPEVPTDARGAVPLTFVDAAETFEGVIAHWHLTPRRWDPGPGFDWARLLRLLTGSPDQR
jgi:N-acetyl-anhydromuramyl-L-alanine amidase AmpD